VPHFSNFGKEILLAGGEKTMMSTSEGSGVTNDARNWYKGKGLSSLKGGFGQKGGVKTRRRERPVLNLGSNLENTASLHTKVGFSGRPRKKEGGGWFAERDRGGGRLLTFDKGKVKNMWKEGDLPSEKGEGTIRRGKWSSSTIKKLGQRMFYKTWTKVLSGKGEEKDLLWVLAEKERGENESDYNGGNLKCMFFGEEKITMVGKGGVI